MADACMVFFRSGECNIELAQQSLGRDGLDVIRKGDYLVVTRPDAPTFCVRYSDDPHVWLEAVELASGTAYEEAFAECTARFEIEIKDLDEALDEINTLMEIQCALQDASHGYLYIPWSDTILEPQSGSGAA